MRSGERRKMGTKNESGAGERMEEGEETLGRRFRGMCPLRLKTSQPLTNKSPTLGWEGGEGRAPQFSSIASPPNHRSTSLLLLVFWKTEKDELCVPVHGCISWDCIPETHRAVIPFSVLCGSSCVCFNVLMGNRQMKRMYSGSVWMCGCFIACGFYPSQNCTPPLA